MTVIRSGIVALACMAALGLSTAEAAEIYPDAARKDYRDTASLTPADWVGPDGIVYPRWDRAGVTGGIPSADWPVVKTLPAEPPGRDITAELQAALDEFGPGSDGRVIAIPAGTFRISGPILMIYDNMAIRGAGMGEAVGKMEGNLWVRDQGAPEQGTRLIFGLPWPEDGAPFVITTRFGGAVTGESSFTVFADPRYEFKHENDPVQPIKTIDRLGIVFKDANGRTLAEKNFAPGRDDPHLSAGIPASDVASVLSGRESAKVQAWVRYKDGTRLEGPDQPLDRIEWERPILRDHRRPIRSIRTGVDAVFLFLGDQWNHRNNDQFLAEPALRGASTLVFENDLSLEENGGIAPGDILIVDAKNSDFLKAQTGGGHPRRQAVTVKSVDGRTVEIEEVLRVSFPVTEGSESRITSMKPRFPVHHVGIEDLTIEFDNPADWINVFSAVAARQLWLRGVRVENAGRNPCFLVGVLNAEVRDCEFLGAHWPKAGGASAYVGMAGCENSLFDNIRGAGLRHGPDFHGGTGNVFRNSVMAGSDLQWHNGYGVEHLVENVTVGDNTRGGSYGRAIYTPTTANQIHSPPGPRNVIFGSDLYGRTGGSELGGFQQGWIIAYNRIKADRGPGFNFRDRQTDHIVIGNTVIMDNEFLPVVTHGALHGRDRENKALATTNTGIDFIANRIHGSNGVINGGLPETGNALTPLRRSYGNEILPPDPAAPRPDPAARPMVSLFETQRLHPDGLPPTGEPLYNPDPQFTGAPDRIHNPGNPVVQVNFLPANDVKHQPENWLAETGEAFSRRGDWTYGWSGEVGAHKPNRDPFFLNDTNNDFGREGDQSWAIELPPGRYTVRVGLGHSRFPTWNAYDWGQPLTSYDAVHDILVNGHLIKDADGHMDQYDAYETVVTVGPESGNRLVISPGPDSNQLFLRYVRIFAAPPGA
jgi:hypothetical protein